MLAVIAEACPEDIVVVLPARAVELVVPKPGNVVLAVLAVIAEACPEVIPVLAVLAVIADACD